jgi:hypothetical protein
VTKVAEGYLIVGNPYKPDKAITVSEAAWRELVRRRDEINAAFREPDEKDWVLEKTPSGDVRASVSVFNNRTYVHVRAWSGLYPTKNGTTVWAWGDFAELLRRAADDSAIDVDEDEEVKLGSETYGDILTESATEEIRRLCEGCVNDWPSQQDHACLTGCPGTVAEAVGNVSVSPEYFAVRLAQAAMERSYVLGRVPRATLEEVIARHDDRLRETLREKLIADY